MILGIVFGLYVLVSTALVVYLLQSQTREREQLEDRLMALSKPEALITYQAATDHEPAQVSYVDEAAEVELAKKNGHPDMLGDD